MELILNISGRSSRTMLSSVIRITKWFALVASIGRDKLGLDGKGYIDVINLKINDPMLQDELIHENGIFPAYHMNKKHWITVLLDGTIPKKQVENLIDVSFLATGNKKKVYKRTDMPGLLFSRSHE